MTRLYDFQLSTQQGNNILTLNRFSDLSPNDPWEWDFERQNGYFDHERDEWITLDELLLYELSEDLQTTSLEELPQGMDIRETTLTWETIESLKDYLLYGTDENYSLGYEKDYDQLLENPDIMNYLFQLIEEGDTKPRYNEYLPYI